MSGNLSMVGKLTREDLRKQKDLETARKAGTAPAQVDEDGKAINPHIPQFMAQAPWYMDTGKPSLSHQKAPQGEFEFRSAALSNKYTLTTVQAATKFRKGACENCGSMTHRKADCLERPRKKGARWTGKNIAQDEFLEEREGLSKDFDAKRDRYDGYDPATYSRVVAEHEALEDARKKMREDEIDKESTDIKKVQKVAKVGKAHKQKDDDDFGSSDESDDDDELKYADAADVVGQKMDTKTRVTVRNLRIREDTAKYLLNLDENSAHYDPKTRSMRDNPHGEDQDPDAVAFAGENFIRASGHAADMQKLQLFAWQSEQRGNDVHLNANPTKAALIHKQFQEKKEALKGSTSKTILDKYGGEEHLKKIPKELLSGQTENYVEYSRAGQVIKGQERAKAKSKYDEDYYPGNHQSVWGSYFDVSSQKWGFACCHSVIRGSYCVGEIGKEEDRPAPPPKAIEAPPSTKKRRAEEESTERDKKKYLSGSSTNITEEEMEEYRRKKERNKMEDPMANLKDDEILPL